jgi:hypothetical protein
MTDADFNTFMLQLDQDANTILNAKPTIEAVQTWLATDLHPTDES